jgi:HlyD family secretion protein
MSEMEMDSKRKRLMGRMIVFFVVGMALLTFLSNTINNFSLPVVQYESPGAGMLIESITASGTVTAKRTHSICMESSRLVEEVKVKIGDRVNQGQVLVILDRTELETQLEQSQIRYEQLKLALDKSESRSKNKEHALENMRALYSIGGESRANLELAEQELVDLKNDQQKARDDLRLHEMDMAKLRKELGVGSVLTAPFAGAVTALNYSPGDRTNPSQPVATVAALNGGFIFTAIIDVESAEHLAVGDPATVSLGRLDGQRIQGRITEIRETQGQVGVKKDLLVDLPGEGFSGGESGELTIEKNIGYYKLLVSNSAIGDGDNGKFVYVLQEKRGPLGNEYYTQQVNVALGESDALKTAILNGLQDGDRVITGSDKQIGDGSRVMINQ